MTITLPIEIVRDVLNADTVRALDEAVIALRRAYTVATKKSPNEPIEDDDADEWADLDPNELPRF